jgi:putative hydrolase of the HAD superfamily
MQIQAVVFDYGNVLSLPQPENALQEMSAKVCMDVREFEKHYWDLRVGYDAGTTSGLTYWHELASRGGCKLDSKSWARENKAMSEFARAVRRAGFRTAILSNMPKDFRDYLPVGVQWLPEFDHHTYSCELNVTKPDHRIYAHSIRGLRLEPERLLFIDDREANTEAAAKMGIQTVLFQTTEQALEAASRLCNVAV